MLVYTCQKRECVKTIAARPERAEAHSPGQRPGEKCKLNQRRPVRAKAFCFNAFALTGRFDVVLSHTQGAALGYEIIGLSARID